jgi:hypothetical protein
MKIWVWHDSCTSKDILVINRLKEDQFIEIYVGILGNYW